MTYPKGWTESFPLCSLIFSWKHLMTGPAGNSEFYFSSTSIIESLGETKLSVSLKATLVHYAKLKNKQPFTCFSAALNLMLFG